jgi:lipoprotein-anchoring transpeptidase ErfK/SrfK
MGTAALSTLALAGCATSGGGMRAVPAAPRIDETYLRMYAAMPEERFPIPAMDISRLDPMYWRQMVSDPTGERAGTVVVDTGNRFLYHVREGGMAMRYGVGIGRDGFAWSGRATIAMKRAWPTWTPPAEMIAREPELEEWRQGMPPRLDNPLGARALYIFQDGRDTLYRLHGSGDVASIGKAISSGCVRLLHQDVIDLHDRVAVGSPILVM